MSEGSAAPQVETLTQIWRRVLQRSSISPDDNFFDLGGNDSSADQLFSEIAQVYGRELPSATIFHAPTIRALAAVLDLPALPEFSPFIRLKPGSEAPPIFITHGIGGRASFSQLAKHIQTAHPVYGIQARGVDGLEEPFARIEDMAAFYIEALDQMQPQGPYLLVGYSFGGLVALEMAQRLRNRGKSIALLVLIDTYPHPRYMPAGERAWLMARKARSYFSALSDMPFRKGVSHMLRGLERRSRMAGGQNTVASPPAGPRLSLARTTLRVKNSDLAAIGRYRPAFYHGTVKFIRPEANSYLPNDPTSVWKGLVSELDVETVPGDHLGMVGTQFQTLASVLTRYVNEALDRKQGQA